MKKLRLAPDVRIEGEDGGSAFLFHGATGEVFSLNGTGALLARRLAAAKGPEDLARLLTTGFRVDPETARRDVAAFLAAMEEAGIVRHG